MKNEINKLNREAWLLSNQASLYYLSMIKFEAFLNKKYLEKLKYFDQWIRLNIK